MIDFEKAFVKAFRSLFPITLIKGCHFHFGQCIYRHIQSGGLQVKYGNDSDFALAVKKLIALAFVPVDDVVYAYESFLSSEEFEKYEEELEGIISYFELTWIGVRMRSGRRKSPLFSVEMWNCFDAVANDLPRTNNAVEGWHHGFNNRVRLSHTSLGKFKEVLIDEQNTTEIYLEQRVAERDVSNKKRRKYIDYDRLMEHVNNYDKNNILEYLKGDAHNVVI